MGIIGVDLASRPATVVQRTPGRTPIVARLGGTDALGPRVVAAIARMGMSGRDIQLVVGGDACHVSPLELPPRSSGAPIDRLAAQEMSRLFRLESGKFELATWDVPGPASGTTLLAVALEHERSGALVREFGVVGLDVAGIEPACAVMSELAAGPGAACILDLSWSCASLLVVDGARAVIERSWAEGGCEVLSGELRKALGLDAPATAFVLAEIFEGRGSDLPANIRERIEGLIHDHASRVASEVRASIAYAERRLGEARVSSAKLIGVGARLEAFVAALRSAGVDGVGVWTCEGMAGSAPIYALAHAAAGRGA